MRYSNEAWYARNPPKTVRVDTIRLDDFLEQESLRPDVIKIDVEGAENLVISGLLPYLKDNSPQIAMEYATADNAPHRQAAASLAAEGYLSYAIDAAGGLQELTDIESYLTGLGLESDNIVFRRPPIGAFQ